MNYEILANAIVEQAAQDYRWARAGLAKAAENVAATAMRSETEQFFRAAWIGQLTSIDGEWLLEKLEGEFV